MGIFAHANNEDQIAAGAGKGIKPYLSPGLSGTYKHNHWTVEIIIGTIIGLLGVIFIIVHYATPDPAFGPKGKEFLYAGCAFAVFGGLIILLGLCWYKNLQKAKPKEEGNDGEMNSLNVEPGMMQQTTLAG